VSAIDRLTVTDQCVPYLVVVGVHEYRTADAHDALKILQHAECPATMYVDGVPFARSRGQDEKGDER
jgi:hypothetical protein